MAAILLRHRRRPGQIQSQAERPPCSRDQGRALRRGIELHVSRDYHADVLERSESESGAVRHAGCRTPLGCPVSRVYHQPGRSAQQRGVLLQHRAILGPSGFRSFRQGHELSGGVRRSQHSGRSRVPARLGRESQPLVPCVRRADELRLAASARDAASGRPVSHRTGARPARERQRIQRAHGHHPR